MCYSIVANLKKFRYLRYQNQDGLSVCDVQVYPDFVHLDPRLLLYLHPCPSVCEEIPGGWDHGFGEVISTLLILFYHKMIPMHYLPDTLSPRYQFVRWRWTAGQPWNLWRPPPSLSVLRSHDYNTTKCSPLVGLVHLKMLWKYVDCIRDERRDIRWNIAWAWFKS